MGEELGFDVQHGPEMTLSSMIDAGVHKLGERLQEISRYIFWIYLLFSLNSCPFTRNLMCSSASKEFALEKAMAKMKGEWEQVGDKLPPVRIQPRTYDR